MSTALTRNGTTAHISELEFQAPLGMIKQYTFEELPQVNGITLHLAVYYWHLPAKLDALPEDHYPEEEELAIIPEAWYEQVIMSAYVAAARLAIKQIDGQIADIDAATVREWTANVEEQ